MAKENRGDSDRRQDDRRKEGAVVPPDGVERRQGNRRQDERRKPDEWGPFDVRVPSVDALSNADGDLEYLARSGMLPSGRTLMQR